MGKVQKLIHVHSRISFAKVKNDHLPTCDDTVCLLRISGDCSISRFALSTS